MGNPDRGADTYAYSHSYGYVYAYTYSNSYSHAYTDTNGHVYSYADTDSHSHGYINPNTYPDADGCEANTDTQTPANAGPAPESLA